MLAKIEAALSRVNYPTRPEGLYEPIAYTLSMGGKRLRPTLLLMAYSLYREDIERAMPAAIGIETYHNHTLLHDDLMDHADIRRGQPTVHKKWDENTAVLSGDAMLILAFRHIMKTETTRKDNVLELFARTTAEICEGQQYDVNFESRTDVTEIEYIEMIRLKTSVLLACAVSIGAMIAEAPKNDSEVLYRFAERIGIAFQLQDDYLDVYGDPKVFGKKIGGDILCGKKTFLLINALNRANEKDKAELLALFDNKDIDDTKKITRVTEIYNQLGIPELTLDTINQYYAEAHRELKNLTLPEVQYRPIWTYTESLLGRNK